MNVEWVPLGEVLIRAGNAVAVDPTAVYPTLGVKSHARGAFDSGVMHGSRTAYATLTQVKEGWLVYPKLMAWEGALAIVPAELNGRWVTPEFVTYEIANDALSLEFLRHLIAWPGFLEHVQAGSTGTNVRRRRLQPTALEAIRIALPTRGEQDRIASHLASVSTRMVSARLSTASLDSRLPQLLGCALRGRTRRTAALRELATNQQVVIHPGDGLHGASEFVGLEHIESHTGRRLGGRPIGDETGRKLLFTPGQVTYGYLRPYLNKAWVADRTGLCSVEQFTLTSNPGVDPRVLSVVLRSDSVWLAAQSATNSLQLPRLSLGALMSFEVPDVRGIAWESIAPEVERITSLIVREAKLRSQRRHLHDSILPAARNQIFRSMR